MGGGFHPGGGYVGFVISWNFSTLSKHVVIFKINDILIWNSSQKLKVNFSDIQSLVQYGKFSPFHYKSQPISIQLFILIADCDSTFAVL